MFEQHISRETDIRYINPTAIKQTVNIFKLFAIENKNSWICFSQRGSKIAAQSFKSKITITIFIIGEKMVANNKNNPATPTAFLISTLLAIITLMPSDR